MVYFPQYLKKTWLNKSENIDDNNIKVVIDRMNECVRTDKFHGYYNVLIDPHVFTSHSILSDHYFVQHNFIYECHCNRDFQQLIIWINKNIVLKSTTDSYQTMGVKIRIATCMLNKLVEEGKLNEHFGKLAHNIMVSNISELYNLIILEELPF